MISSLYKDILSGYEAWEESPLGKIALSVALVIRTITTWAVPLAYAYLIFKLPLLRSASLGSCINTWIVLLGLPAFLFGAPVIRALKQSTKYKRRWCYC